MQPNQETILLVFLLGGGLSQKGQQNAMFSTNLAPLKHDLGKCVLCLYDEADPNLGVTGYPS